MAGRLEVTCACGCGDRFPLEEMVELEGGQHVTPECLEAVMMRGSLDEIFPRDSAGETRPIADPDEATHRRQDKRGQVG
jgi:Zn-finger nucleic acid-binding protein